MHARTHPNLLLFIRMDVRKIYKCVKCNGAQTKKPGFVDAHHVLLIFIIPER